MREANKKRDRLTNPIITQNKNQNDPAVRRQNQRSDKLTPFQVQLPDNIFLGEIYAPSADTEINTESNKIHNPHSGQFPFLQSDIRDCTLKIFSCYY